MEPPLTWEAALAIWDSIPGIGRRVAEQLVAEHERSLVVWRNAEQPMRDLAIGAAHTDLEHPYRDVVGGDDGRIEVFEPRRVGDARLRDERLHGASTAPSDAEPTSAR